jgi:hypothetical protein
MSLHAEWQPVLDEVIGFADPLIKQYLTQLCFPLIGALSPSVLNPETGKLVTLDASNWATLGRRAANSLTEAMYRYGDVILQKYDLGYGGYPHWHSEIFPDRGDSDSLHRVLFFMFYLNDVSAGGETEFYFQKLKVTPRRGTMLIAPAGFTHTHRGNVPVSSDKYIVTSWLLFKRAEQMYSGPR